MYIISQNFNSLLFMTEAGLLNQFTGKYNFNCRKSTYQSGNSKFYKKIVTERI